MYDELKQLLVDAAKEQRPVYYEEIAPLFDFDYDRDQDRAEVGRILGVVSEEEVAAQRPMLSAVVVHKGGDEMPGKGFFDLARKLGRFRGGDPKIYWAMELKELYEYWERSDV
jgi:hypothetical protein